MVSSSHMLCRAIGSNDASIRSHSHRTFLRKASAGAEPTAGRMRPIMVLDCQMKAFTKRFSGVSAVDLGMGWRGHAEVRGGSTAPRTYRCLSDWRSLPLVRATVLVASRLQPSRMSFARALAGVNRASAPRR